MEDIQIGLMLLAVGMATVFSVLFIIIFFGKLLIRIVNRFFPEKPIVKADTTMSIEEKHAAIITAAVQTITQGKGRVEKIEKV